jgi:NAD(P)-dependent dehydrogenase (short-subunit alcohol dehydrogenase family)
MRVGVIGACEDQDEHEVRSQLETNFFGTLNIVALSLPIFREQKHGRYLVFSSTAGALGVPGLGPYCAAKFAVEGMLESMLYEVDTFNIKATLVEPGHMRLDEPDSQAMGLQRYSAFKVKDPSPPYADSRAPAQHAQRMVRWLVDRQPISTVRSAELVWQLAHCKYPPLRLILGTYAVESIRDRLRTVIEEVSKAIVEISILA